ncbi:cephalosporin hydroxylase family protein [uncultured Oceanisphaera sp.]|uniref:cephalosporin hydroxylase family protein n=1 Tax=uncultured Oceanisphaera sp. TaxID=353858 RepID=UPI0026074BEE|nr:cephalosporin hydroxylase family protein [uncultured Oceanisphaera sp.]
MNEIEKFEIEVQGNIDSLMSDKDLQALSRIWIREIIPHKWVYNFSWLGRPAIQVPNDAWALQELVWKIKPDLIIETGIAHGGSLMVSASLLALLDYTDAVESGQVLDPKSSKRKVIGIDIDIRQHNREAIEQHPLSHKIQMFEGSSIDPSIVNAVKEAAKGYQRILVCLDSNHTHDHVLAELEAYASLVTPGSYCIVYDTIVEDMPESMFQDRPWKPGNSPKSAVSAFLNKCDDFLADERMDAKLLISVANGGFLKRL